jgi:glycosyltransferase involved in cell wall biosynthesis
MIVVILSAVWCLLLVHVLYKLIRSEVYRVNVRYHPAQAQQPLPPVRVVVPMRNEAANIALCVNGLLAQQYPGPLEVVVVDDGSTDGSHQIVADIRQQHNHPHIALHLINAPPLPPGWSGKSNGCQAGAHHATGNVPQYLIFMDADVQPKPHLVHAAIAHSLKHNADLVSLIPRQRLDTIGERLVLSAIFIMVADAMDFKRIHSPTERQYATADGQFLLFRKQAYDDMGGHASVAHHVMEDIAFAENCKREGRTIRFDWGHQLMACRMYDNFAKAWNGMSNNLLRILGRTPAQATLMSLKYVSLALGLLVLPWLAYVLHTTTPADFWLAAAWWLSAGTGAVLVAVFIGCTIFFGISPLNAVWFVPSLVLQFFVLRNSIQRNKTGRFYWRGRTLNAS